MMLTQLQLERLNVGMCSQRDWKCSDLINGLYGFSFMSLMHCAVKVCNAIVSGSQVTKNILDIRII
jgi:hypothetical protein